MAVITISREFGSGGEAIAGRVAEELGFLLVNKKTIIDGLAAYGIKEPDLVGTEKIAPKRKSDGFKQYTEALHNFLYNLAIKENLVIIGRGGNILFQDFIVSFHVKIVAPKKVKLKRIMKAHHLKREGALKLLEEQDKNKEEYLKKVFQHEINNIYKYDLIINTANITFEDASQIILAAFQLHKERTGSGKTKRQTAGKAKTVEVSNPAFMHASEKEFARMLDFYQIKWEYEPKTFPLEWDSEGNIIEAFTPDFYLPDQNTYIELTTQRQKLVWKKNKKVRRLKELYPDINIKIMYNKDYRSLLDKFGLETGDGQIEKQ
ncbi:MAG TPA: hypothetical protein GX697_00920 [Firmicutes bacterium]|nr:hypothetical protein [Bacillota bacterium]